MTTAPAPITFSDLRRRHAAVLFDAYGVLLDASGALPGAVEAVHALLRDGQPFLVVTNDASRRAEQAAARYGALGLPLTPAHIISSGMLIGPALIRHGLVGKRVVMLGPRDAQQWAREVGAQVVDPDVHAPADAVVLADEGGYDVIDTLDGVLSMVIAACRTGRPPTLLLANPDLIYPSGGNYFGITAGSFALMLEHALALVLGADAPTFEPLGKPSPGHFHAALELLGTRDAVMIGDQLRTDIAGANAAGIASAIVLTGVTDRDAAVAPGPHAPTYLLTDLRG